MDGFLPWRKILIFGVELFFGINVVLLDMYVFLQTHGNLPSFALSTRVLPMPTPTPPCPINCVTLIQQATQSALFQQSLQNAKQQAPSLVSPAPLVKEFFIPLGSGQSTATTMTNVPGVASYLNSSLYPNMKSVTFEIGVQTPGANQIAYIQLFDVTDNYVVWNSQMSWTGGDSQFLFSNPIQLPAGNKLYQVQMSTQLGFVSLLNSARIHIVLN